MFLVPCKAQVLVCYINVILVHCWVVARQNDGVITWLIDENLQGPKMYLCGSSAHDRVLEFMYFWY